MDGWLTTHREGDKGGCVVGWRTFLDDVGDVDVITDESLGC